MSEYLVLDMRPPIRYGSELTAGDGFRIIAQEGTLTEALEQAKEHHCNTKGKCDMCIFKHAGSGIYEYYIKVVM